MSILQDKCPNCGAELIYDPIKRTYNCQYCNSIFFDSQSEDIDNNLKEKNHIIKKDNVYICPNCKEKLHVKNIEDEIFCPYCKRFVLIDSKNSNTADITGIIPFSISRDEAINIIFEKLKSKKLKPKSFNFENVDTNIKGIYVQYFCLDATYWTLIKFNSERGDKKYRTRKEDTVFIKGIHKVALDNENSDFCDVVRPYDLNDIIAYDGKYTSNFEVMTSNVTSAKSENSLEKQINEFLKNKEKEEIEKEQYKNVFYNDFQQKNICKRIKYNLFPVWILNYKYERKNYVNVINGQTGKLCAHIPISKMKVLFLFISLIFIISFLICFLLMVFEYYDITKSYHIINNPGFKPAIVISLLIVIYNIATYSRDGEENLDLLYKRVNFKNIFFSEKEQ